MDGCLLFRWDLAHHGGFQNLSSMVVVLGRVDHRPRTPPFNLQAEPFSQQALDAPGLFRNVECHTWDRRGDLIGLGDCIQERQAVSLHRRVVGLDRTGASRFDPVMLGNVDAKRTAFTSHGLHHISHHFCNDQPAEGSRAKSLV